MTLPSRASASSVGERPPPRLGRLTRCQPLARVWLAAMEGSLRTPAMQEGGQVGRLAPDEAPRVARRLRANHRLDREPGAGRLVFSVSRIERFSMISRQPFASLYGRCIRLHRERDIRVPDLLCKPNRIVADGRSDARVRATQPMRRDLADRLDLELGEILVGPLDRGGENPATSVLSRLWRTEPRQEHQVASSRACRVRLQHAFSRVIGRPRRVVFALAGCCRVRQRSCPQGRALGRRELA